MPVSTHEIPVISTAHITLEVATRLDAENDRNPWCPCAAWSYGYFLYLDEPEAGLTEPPQCLLDIRDWLRKQPMQVDGRLGTPGSCWVRLDSDAEKVDGLPTYDW
jgi:hypothetical protein